MYVYKELEFTYQGEAYSIKPTFEVIQKLEAAGVSAIVLAARISMGQLPIADTAKFMQMLLKQCGIALPIEEVHHNVSVAEEDLQSAFNVVNEAVVCFHPVSESQDELKKSQAEQ